MERARHGGGLRCRVSQSHADRLRGGRARWWPSPAPGAALFVFTFSRHTLPASVAPVAGETFVFTQFSGAPQCFLTEAQLVDELRSAGFVPDPALPLRELNRSAPGLRTGGPVIYEGAFRLSRGNQP